MNSPNPKSGNPEFTEPLLAVETDVSSASNQPLTEEQLSKQQEEYRRAYLEQLRRMSCPGCGDDGIVPY